MNGQSRHALLLVAFSLLIAATRTLLAQYIPPIPKRIEGNTPIEARIIPLPAAKRWIRARSPRFTIISSADDRTTIDVARSLETLAGALQEIHPRFARTNINTTVLLFGRRRDSQPYFDLLLNRSRAEAPGIFVAQPDGSGTMVIDGARALVDRTVFHELAHNLLIGSGARLPLWLEEGLAEYFSTAEIRRGRVVVGIPVREHVSLLRTRAPIPLVNLLSAETASAVAQQTLFYAQSWALVDWMMSTDRKAFYPFIADVEAGQPLAGALKKYYHADIAAVERAIGRREHLDASFAVRAGQTGVFTVHTEALPPAEALSELAQFLGTMEVSRTDAEKFYRAALEIDPGYGRAQAGLGTLRLRQKNYLEASQFFERALEVSPEDPAVLLDVAEGLLRETIGSFVAVAQLDSEAPARFRQARQLALRALQHGGDASRADAVIGTSYLVEDDTHPGIAALERAHTLRPSRYDVALNLYALYLRSGQRSSADLLFQDMFTRPRDAQLTFAARAVFVREQLTAVNRLIAANQMEAAGRIVQEMIDLSPDPKAKSDLESQMRNLRVTIETNRQITAYNAAVAAANRGENHDALRIVEGLLLTARDENVVRDSQRLRGELQRRLKRTRR